MNTKRKKRILVVTQYIYPENFKSNELVFEMAKRGYHVDVLTGIPNYPEGIYFTGYGLFKKRIENKDGVTFYRCLQTPRGRKASGFGLALNYLSFVFFALLTISNCFKYLFNIPSFCSKSSSFAVAFFIVSKTPCLVMFKLAEISVSGIL